MAGKTGTLRPDYLGTLRHYPVPVLAAALLAGWIIGDVLNRQFTLLLPYEKWASPALVFGFFAATAAGFATIHATAWIARTAQGLAFLAGIGLVFLAGVERETILPLLIALVCAVSLAAGLAARQGVAGYWLANARLSANLAACLAAAGIVTLGGALILHSAEALLDLRMRRIDDALAIFLWAFILPVSWLALARFDGIDAADTQGNILLRILALVTDALLIPLMLILAAIIHLYAALIAASGELPRGQIGWIVPVYLVAGYGIFLLARNPEAQFPRLRRLYGFFPAATAVPLILLGLAVAARIEAYGMTKDRYALVLTVIGGALLLGSAAVRHPLDIRLIPATAAILSLVAAIGPLSAINMTIRSQTARAYAILASVPPERWAAAKDGGLSNRQKEDLISAVRYLQHRSWATFETLSSVWPPHFPKELGQLTEMLQESSRRHAIIIFPRADVIRLDTVTLLEFDLNWNVGIQLLESGAFTFEVRADGRFLDVSGEGSSTRFDLSPLLAMEPSLSIKRSEEREGKRVLKSVEGRKADLIVTRFLWEKAQEGRVPNQLQGRIILY